MKHTPYILFFISICILLASIRISGVESVEVSTAPKNVIDTSYEVYSCNGVKYYIYPKQLQVHKEYTSHNYFNEFSFSSAKDMNQWLSQDSAEECSSTNKRDIYEI